MSLFPIHLLNVTDGLFGPHPIAGCFVRIFIAPFDLDGVVVKTSVRLDGVDLPNSDMRALAGQTLNAPINPEAGYIDGSIYIDGAHHPVDVRQIIFGKVEHEKINASFVTEIDFTFEGLGDYQKTPWTFSAMLAWTDEAQNA